MRSPLLVSIVVLALTSAAQSQTSPAKPTRDDYVQMNDDLAYWSAQRERYQQIMLRATELEPTRRDAPLRELNISDDEVREVEAIAYQYLPRTTINISPVVTGCPCEEGLACNAQVYVVSTVKDKWRGLQLSRMNAHWQLGIVQEWWLRFDAIRAPHTGDSFLDFYLTAKARSELYEQFPVCANKVKTRK
jgi:hypothetical protein